MIHRLLEAELEKRINYFPATALLGPRQVGKTTLVKTIRDQLRKPSVYFDLERSTDAAKFAQDRLLLLEQLQDQIVILDEIHRLPDLFPDLRSLIDENRTAGRFVLLGSASPDLLKNTSESLAGRISYVELTPFQLIELNTSDYQKHWLRGGFPNAYLAPSDEIGQIWFSDFVRTYLEKDLPALGLSASPALMGRLLTMVAYSQGGLLNGNSLANSLGISAPSVRTYLDFLDHAFLIRRLSPYFVNIGKRLVKSQKIYLRDSGLLHHLLTLTDLATLLGHPVAGGSWEGYVIEQIVNQLPPGHQPYFYRTADGSELDLVIEHQLRIKAAIEIKLTNAPTLSRGTTVALQDLNNPPLLVVTPSASDYPMRANISVCSVQSLSENLRKLGL